MKRCAWCGESDCELVTCERHLKHECLGCGEQLDPCDTVNEYCDWSCASPEVAARMNGNVEREGCGHECDCESVEAHEAGIAREMAEFLASPGPPPAHFTEEQVERAERGMAAARAELAKVVS